MHNESDMAMLFPTFRVVNEGVSYMWRMTKEESLLVQIRAVHFEIRDAKGTDTLHAIFFPPELWKLAKTFWQNTGMGISSRYADMLLDRIAQDNALVNVEIPSQSRLVCSCIILKCVS